MKHLRVETRALLLFVPVVCVGLNLLLPSLPGQPRGVMTSLHYSDAWARRIAHEDSWKPMRAALDWLSATREVSASPEASATRDEREGKKKGLYDEVLFEQRIKLQYPPTSILPLELLQLLPGDWTSNDALNGISWLAVLATVLLSAGVLERSVRGPPVAVDRWTRVALALVAGLAFYPLARGFYLGQIQTWIDALVAGAVLAWLLGRHATAGSLTALAAIVKPQLGLLLLWSLLRGHRRFSLGFAGVGACALVASLALYGLADHLGYLEALSYIGRHGESFHPNQSVNGLVHRLLGNGNNLRWSDGFPPFDARVYAATLASSALLVAGALFFRRGDAERAPVLDLAIAIVTVTLASPIAWTHHYGVMLPLFAVALAAAASSPAPARALSLGLLALAFLLVGNTFRIANRLADTPWNFAQSYVLFGGLLFLGLLYRLRAHAART